MDSFGVGGSQVQTSGIHPWVCTTSSIIWRHSHQSNLADRFFGSISGFFKSGHKFFIFLNFLGCIFKALIY